MNNNLPVSEVRGGSRQASRFEMKPTKDAQLLNLVKRIAEEPRRSLLKRLFGHYRTPNS